MYGFDTNDVIIVRDPNVPVRNPNGQPMCTELVTTAAAKAHYLPWKDVHYKPCPGEEDMVVIVEESTAEEEDPDEEDVPIDRGLRKRDVPPPVAAEEPETGAPAEDLDENSMKRILEENYGIFKRMLGEIRKAKAEAKAEVEAETEAAAKAEAEEPALPAAEPEAEEPVDSDKITGAPVAAPIEAPVEATIEAPFEAPVEDPAEEPAEEPAEVPVEAPAEDPAEAPAQAPAKAPAQAPARYTEPTHDNEGNELRRVQAGAPRDGAVELWSERGFVGHKAVYGRALDRCDTIDTLTHGHHGFGKSVQVRKEGVCCVLYSGRGCHGHKLTVGSRMPTLAPYDFDDKAKSVYCMGPESCKAYFANGRHRVNHGH